ncbi:hypothetical protein JKY72_01090 [Candidatus Gracilibacteria bacterium]|nr:hypothetical protein [Candidatus Gracilibacteria bacterium]
MFLKILKKVSASLGLVVLLASNSVFAASTVLEAYAMDTIAGNYTSLRSSQVYAGSNVDFAVEKPNGELVHLSAEANSSGVARANLSDFHLKTAGTYSVSANVDGFSSRSNSFEVYPGSVSGHFSTVSPADQVVGAGDDAFVKVRLVDNYKNPLSGHVVKLISSAARDRIESVSGLLTDENGEITFSLESEARTAVTYTVYDATEDKVLDARARVVYFENGASLFGMTAFASSTGAGSANVDHFTFDDIPESIFPNESFTFTLRAEDILDDTVVNYGGEVRFFALGSNAPYANLPDDYTFEIEDLGEHTFSLTMSFQELGVYEIEVRDIDDPDLIVTEQFIVVAKSGVDGFSPSTAVSIVSPGAGTYSNSVQVISGAAEPGSLLKIYDNAVPIGEVVSGVDGTFSYTSGLLTDGMHKITVAIVNEIGTIQDSVDVVLNIDTSAPTVTNVETEPANGITPSSVVKIKLDSIEALSQAAVVFQDNIYEMTLNDAGYYEASILSPSLAGDYLVSFIIVDELGNETRLDDEFVLEVGNSSAAVGDVTSLSAESADGRVVLRWDGPTSNFPVKNYRVYYGVNPNELNAAVDTFTASGTWFVPGLSNGQKYYFAVIAIDINGDISEHFSNIVDATPGVLLDYTPIEVIAGTAGGDALAEMESEVSDTGPEVLWLLFPSLLGGLFYRRQRKR